MLSNLLRLGFPEVPNETLSGYKEILVTECYFLPSNQTGPPSPRRRLLILLHPLSEVTNILYPLALVILPLVLIG